MKRFAVTAFAVLYAIFVISVTAERCNEWAAQEALERGHSSIDEHFVAFGPLGKSEPRPQYKRIIQRAFVVESPRESTGVSTPPSVRHTPILHFEYQAVWNGWTASLRAPPSLI